MMLLVYSKRIADQFIIFPFWLQFVSTMELGTSKERHFHALTVAIPAYAWEIIMSEAHSSIAVS